MPLTWKDRVKQAVSAGGSGALTLGAASSGYQAFAAGDDGKLFSYVIEDGTAWETGYGTYTHSGTSFARTSRTASSTGGALTVTTSAFVYVDLVSSLANGMDLAAQAVTPGGRLTLTSGTPVTTSDVTGATNIYYTPYRHNIINLWDGNRWSPVVFAETTLALGTITAARPYDVFGYLSGGVLALELLAWSSDSARATAVTLQDGRYCKSGDKTRLLLGTFYTTSTTTTEDSNANRYLSNTYNQVGRKLELYVAASHSYGSASFREYNGDSSSRVNFMSCVVGIAANGALQANRNSAYSIFLPWLDGSPEAGQTGYRISIGATDYGSSVPYAWSPAPGKHYIAGAEYASSACTYSEFLHAGVIDG